MPLYNVYAGTGDPDDLTLRHHRHQAPPGNQLRQRYELPQIVDHPGKRRKQNIQDSEGQVFNRRLRIGDVDVVIDDPARMGHPLASDHELVFDGLAMGVAEAAVPAGQADAALHRLLEVPLLLRLDVGHGEDVDDEIERLQLGEIEVGIEGMGDLDALSRPRV